MLVIYATDTHAIMDMTDKRSHAVNRLSGAARKQIYSVFTSWKTLTGSASTAPPMPESLRALLRFISQEHEKSRARRQGQIMNNTLQNLYHDHDARIAYENSDNNDRNDLITNFGPGASQQSAQPEVPTNEIVVSVSQQITQYETPMNGTDTSKSRIYHTA